MKIKILTDTSCGMTKTDLDRLDIEVMGLPFIIDDCEYSAENLNGDMLYDMLGKCKTFSTSQAPINVVTDTFDRILCEYDKILYFPITSGLSGSYNTGMMLINDEKYKGKVYCIDHKSISVTLKSIFVDVRNLIEKGVEIEKIVELIEHNERNSIWLIVDTLDNFKKGGRINAITAMIGNLLNIKPILFSDGDKFEMIKKERSLKKATDTIKELIIADMTKRVGKVDFTGYRLGVAYTDNMDNAIVLKNELMDCFGIKEIYIDPLPSVVVCHTGLGAIGTAISKIIDEH